MLRSRRYLKAAGISLLFLLASAAAIAWAPRLLEQRSASYVQRQEFSALPDQFPVSVDPKSKTIVENAQIDEYLRNEHSLEAAVAGSGGDILRDVLAWIAARIGGARAGDSIAAAGERFVIVNAGYRKEQVASAFGGALGWTAAEKKAFLAPEKGAKLPFSEGTFAPGAYFIAAGSDPQEAQALVNARFSDDVLSHYGTSTQKAVPLEQALTIASIIQRETIGTDGMRLVSGIIWNRLFAGMKLQIDATLQYAKASRASAGEWWPDVVSGDTGIKSPYNTYLHAGLPPSPISNPSVAAILAALNPIKTDCLFYFNDKTGALHCSATYAEHRKLLAEYYRD